MREVEQPRGRAMMLHQGEPTQSVVWRRKRSQVGARAALEIFQEVFFDAIVLAEKVTPLDGGFQGPRSVALATKNVEWIELGETTQSIRPACHSDFRKCSAHA